MLRWIARVLVGVLVVVFLLVLTMNSGRGFLPSTRRTIWLDVRRVGARGWMAVVHSVGEDAPFPDAPDERDVIRVSLLETSKGRSRLGGLLDSSRCSAWVVQSVRRADGSEAWLEEGLATMAPEAEAALASCVEREVIPRSEALAIWPRRPTDGVIRNGASWWVWQNRFNVGGGIGLVVFSVACGALCAALVLPRRVVSTS